MANITKSVTIPSELWVAFEKQNPSINFSKWVSQQIAKTIKQKGSSKNKIDMKQFAKMTGLTEDELQEIISEADREKMD